MFATATPLGNALRNRGIHYTSSILTPRVATLFSSHERFCRGSNLCGTGTLMKFHDFWAFTGLTCTLVRLLILMEQGKICFCKWCRFTCLWCSLFTNCKGEDVCQWCIIVFDAATTWTLLNKHTRCLLIYFTYNAICFKSKYTFLSLHLTKHVKLKCHTLSSAI